MGRFFAIVLVLVVAALVVNCFIGQGDDTGDTTAAISGADVPQEGASATAADTVSPPSSPPGEEEILLGTDELTAGVPGTGPLTADQAKTWLADSRNHTVLKPLLPKGLAAGAAQIVGIDENPLTRAKIELGRQLYFDTRLSVDNTISCASCHDPEFGFAKNTQFGIGVEGQEGGRNSPIAYNRILSGAQFWDGRAESLEAQAIGPIANPIEMGNTHEAVVEMLGENAVYTAQFEKIFDDGVTIENVGKAIASFERALVTAPSPWDFYVELRDFEKIYADDLEDIDFLKEDDPDLHEEYLTVKLASAVHPIEESAQRGGELFFSDKAGCTACHVGANFSDEKYHNLGVGMAIDGVAIDEPDLGRFAETNEDADRGAFKTPTVRNVSQSAPYMHDGSVATLEEVVELYVKGGEANPHLSEKVKKLEITDQDKADLVAFMKALTGEFPKIESERLPE